MNFFKKQWESNSSHFLIPLLLFMGIFFIYKTINPEPRNWYDHYLYLSRSLLNLRVDIPSMPASYHDKLVLNNKIYLPFPPGASLVLIPALLLKSNITQQLVSIIVGSLSVSLIYILMLNFTNRKNAILLAIFVGLGTPFFWSSVVGTSWFFAHIVAILFLTISLLCHFQKKDVLSGVFLALGALTRLPLVLAGTFYLLQLIKDKQRFFRFFISACIVFIPIFTLYNYLRFENVFKTGYKDVYMQYINMSYPVTIRQIKNPEAKYFNYMDIRNIPLGLYTLFAMPPDESKPSPYGMGIIFTSPLLLLAFLPELKDEKQRNLFISAVVTSIPTMLHYAQGWVQFGYRYMLDYLVFLILILAIKFKPSIPNILLLIISIAVNFWGVRWAIQLGW